MKVFLIFYLVPLICADTLVTINSSKIINDISEKFISHEIDFYDLMQYRGNLALATPSYVKLTNFFKFINNFHDLDESEKSGIYNVFKSLYNNKITPVIVIDYNIKSFEPITLLHELKRARELDIKECIWQLGDNTIEFSHGNKKKYTEDLKTLQILCESVRKDNKFNWKVAAVSAFSDDKNSLAIEGYDFGRFTKDELLTKSIIKAKDERNVWITIANNSVDVKKSNYHANPELCDENCLINGLQYAQILGESAKKGVDVIFIENQDIASINANVFKQAIDNIHNALIGTRAFNVRSSKSSYDKKQSSVYAYCSKKMNGGVTLMGINYSNARDKINSKLSTSIESNSIVLQYILNIADGHVMVNNEKYNGTIVPVYKFKKNTKFSLDLTIPPYSIAFWVLKNANEKACMTNLRNEDGNKVRTKSTVISSSDDLLKTLASNALRKEGERKKRQISSISPLLPKFDLKFSDLIPSNINQRSIKDVFLNKNTEVYKVAPVESNPLQSSENPSLPNGDVYLLIDDGNVDEYSDVEIQYPTTNKKEINQQLKPKNKVNRERNIEKVMPDEYLTSFDYVEKTSKKNVNNSKKKSPSQQQNDVGELFETENINIQYPKHYDQMRSSSNHNIEIKTIARELEPTYRQSKKAIIAAKRKWDQNQLMELLKDATLQEVDKSQIHDVNEFQIIDLSSNDEIPLDYEEYEDNDEDGFFSNDKQKVRTRRSVDYRINEIPRSENLFYDSNENDAALEDFYIHPRHTESKQQQSTPTTIEVDENSALGVKIIDVFSKSLDDVINTVHRNIKSWWYVFSPPTND